MHPHCEILCRVEVSRFMYADMSDLFSPRFGDHIGHHLARLANSKRGEQILDSIPVMLPSIVGCGIPCLRAGSEAPEFHIRPVHKLTGAIGVLVRPCEALRGTGTRLPSRKVKDQDAVSQLAVALSKLEHCSVFELSPY